MQFALSTLKSLTREQGKAWLIAYIATLLVPWALIFNRATTDICTTTIGLLFLWNSRKGGWQWLTDPVIKAGLVLWLWMIFISPFALAVVSSFGIAIPWIRYLLLFAALRFWVLTRREALILLGVNLAIMLSFVVVDSLTQFFTGMSLTGHRRFYTGRLSGPMDSIKVGIFLAKMALPAIGICLIAVYPCRKKSIPVLALLLLATLVITLSGERTAFASNMLGIITAMLLLAFAEPKLRRLCLGVLGALALVAVALYLTQDWVSYRVHYLYTNLSGFRESSYGSLIFIGIDVGKKYWLTGAGFKGFRLACPEYKAAGVGTFCSEHPHNPYVEWFAEAGVVGLILFIVLVVTLLRVAAKEFSCRRGIERLPAAVAVGTCVVQFFPLMATQSNLSNWPTILLWYSLSVAFAALNL